MLRLPRTFKNRLGLSAPEAETPAQAVPLQALPSASRRPAAVPPLRPRVEIPVRDPSPEEEAVRFFRRRGQHLARQDAWEDLAREICAADRDRQLTPGLRNAAALMAEGARSDVISAASNAVKRVEPNHARAAVTALEANLEENPECSSMAFIIAMTHVDVANAWRGASPVKQLNMQRRREFDRCMTAAARLSDQFDAFEWDSPLWAMVRCSVLDADPTPAQRVCDDYEDLIELDPNCPDHMRALGRDLLPRRHGTFEVLDRQARRTAMHVSDIWGMGGYSWVWMGAIEVDISCLRRVDIALFREGMRDIADRFPDQYMINRLAAFTGVTLPKVLTGGRACDRLADDFDWIAGERLTELHPIAWAMAPSAGSPLPEIEAADLMERGRKRALTTLAERFADRLSGAGRLVFTEDGLQTG